MTRFLIDGLAVAALALTIGLSAPPARADGGGQLLGLLLGVGTFYAIGKGIEQARTPEPTSVSERHRLAGRDDWAAPRRKLPRDCLATFDTWHGELRGFERHCLARSMRAAHHLPPMCAIDTRIGRRDATIYSARCLQIEGWRLAGTRAHREYAPDWRGGGRLGP